jgi:CBS domain-containing protein
MTGPGEPSLFRHRIRDLGRRPVVTCAPDTTVEALARRMLREGVGSILVVGADGAARGIITDRDLRRKVVAEGRDPTTARAGEIMSAPLVTVGSDAFAFEALLEMTRREIHHLVMVEQGRPVGVVSSHDFLLLQATHPVLLAREITQAVSMDALITHARQVTGLVHRLVGEGGSAHDVGQIVAELNDRIVVRALALAAGALEESGEDAPPGDYCWLAFGSEARKEQTLRTDQDNGLVYADPPPHLQARAAAYYARLADTVIEGLVSVGFPRCDGDFMASNPRWRQPLSAWRARLEHWIADPAPEQILAASLVFDLRPVAGALGLAETLRGVIVALAPEQRALHALMASEVVARRVPLTLFGNVAVARRGAHRGRVDVKGAGAMQLAGAARLHALELGLAETNTIQRFRAAGERSLYREDEVREITDAYQHLMRLRLVHQLDQSARGEPPDNYIDPYRLSHADHLLLRDALKTVRRLQANLRDRFVTDRLVS